MIIAHHFRKSSPFEKICQNVIKADNQSAFMSFMHDYFTACSGFLLKQKKTAEPAVIEVVPEGLEPSTH